VKKKFFRSVSGLLIIIFSSCYVCAETPEDSSILEKVGKGTVSTTKTIGQTGVDATKVVGKGVVSVGKEIGEGGVDVGKVIGKGTVDVTKGVGKGVKKVSEEAVDLAKKAKELFYDPIIVSATRLPSVETRLSNLSANISVISASDIAESGADTIQEAIQYAEGVHIFDQVGNGIDSTLNIRGFTDGQETAVLLDGVRVNEADMNVFNPNLINVDTIEQIELVRGASSTLYGDSVFGGILNITTKHPSEKLFSPFGLYEIGSYRKQNFTAGASGTVQDEDFADLPGKMKYYFSGTRKLNGGYRDNGDTRGTWFDAKYGYELENESGEVMFYFKYTDQENHNPGELTFAEEENNRQQSVKPLDNRKFENLNVSVNANKTFFDDRLNVSLNTYRRLNDIDFTSTSRNGDTQNVTTLSTQKGITGQIFYNETIGSFNNQLALGVEYSNGGDSNVSTPMVNNSGFLSNLDNNLNKDDTGFFVQETLDFDGKIIGMIGLRHDEVDFRFEDKIGGTGNVAAFDETTVKTGIVIKPVKYCDVYANFSEAFKAPGASELFDTYRLGNFASNNTNLAPEEADNWEIGIRARYEDRASLSLSWFRIDTSNEIQIIETAPWTYATLNVGETRRYGLETSLNLRATKWLDTYFTHSFTDAKVRATTSSVESGRELGLVPESRFTAGIHVGPIHGVNLWLNGLFVGRQQSQDYQSLSFSTSPIEPYYVFNGKVSYEYKGAEIYFMVNNLFDREYYTRSIYNFAGTIMYTTPAPGREITSGIRFEF